MSVRPTHPEASRGADCPGLGFMAGPEAVAGAVLRQRSLPLCCFASSSAWQQAWQVDQADPAGEQR